MSKRFFTADWHLGSKIVLDVYNRPFDSIEKMNGSLVSACNKIADSKSDIVIHAGDFACFGKDRGEDALSENPNKFMNIIRATFINVEGNHDKQNSVKSIGKFIRLELGSVFTDVCVCHYPSYDIRSSEFIKPGDIVLCGHVHNKWKHFIDKENKVLNINVGVDVWNFKPVSEDKLIDYIKQLLKSSNVPIVR